MAQARNTIGLDATFYHELLRFYKDNKGAIRSRYHVLTRSILDYNDPDKSRSGQFLRRPQFEALEIYIFLKEYLKLRPIQDIFADWYYKQNGFEKRGDIAGVGGKQVLYKELTFNEAAYTAIFKKMQAAKQIYPNYIFALTMGVGKTLLMATCIFYEFVMARKFPKDPLFCHNALIFAPDKTVLQSLREIESFDLAKVLPPEQANWLQANLSLQYLDEAGVTLNVLDGSRYNLIISNTQKIILKKKKKETSASERLFMESTVSGAAKSVYDDVADLYGSNAPEDEQELSVNQRFLKLRKLANLGVFVDEAHHAFGQTLKSDLMEVKKETSLRFSINALAKGIENQGSQMVACYNFTGTPYVKNEVLPEVVYAYGLEEAIRNNYLKSVKLHGYTNPRDKEFVRAVLKDFLAKYGEQKLEGMRPKLAFFAPDIAEANGILRPILEAALAEHNIPASTILVNVGDDKITSNDDLKAFKELDTESSEKRFLILVNKGKEGWNCRSLCGVAMFRKPRSKVFVLQASMRCLRAIGDKQQEGQVYLSDENIQILNDELEQNFRLNTHDLQRAKTEKNLYEVRVLKSKKITFTKVRNLYETQEKELKEQVTFGLDDWDVDKYKLFHTEQKSHLEAGKPTGKMMVEDLTHLKERRVWTTYTLVAEIARYLGASPLKIEKILAESTEGMAALLEKVNEYNELLYDQVIPALFSVLYEVKLYEKKEETEVELVREPENGFYSLYGDPAKTQLFGDWFHKNVEATEKSFHLDTYSFDSIPEQDFFLSAITQDEVEEIYFTGMLTHGQSDFRINYIDPDTHGVRSYYPDFLIRTKSGEWLVVEVKATAFLNAPITKAKQEFAESVLAASNMAYLMVAHDEAGKVKVGDQKTLATQRQIWAVMN